MITPLLANALTFAFEKATIEGKVTISMLVLVSLFSWTVIIQKARQLYRARKMSRQFFEVYRKTRDPLELSRRDTEFPGAPAYEVYATGAEELDYHLKNNPVSIKGKTRIRHEHDILLIEQRIFCEQLHGLVMRFACEMLVGGRCIHPPVFAVPIGFRRYLFVHGQSGPKWLRYFCPSALMVFGPVPVVFT